MSNVSLYAPVMEEHLRKIEQSLPRLLPTAGGSDDPLDGLQSTVIDAMSYACAAGGKRLRPVLVMEFCRLCGGDSDAAMPFACAIEMIHCYSLVHDDLPCMDNSLLRRGRPSTFAKYGENMGLLAGDALLNRAFEIMLVPESYAAIPPKRALAASRCLAEAAGIYGMIGGQVIDLQSENKTIGLAALELLQRGKTMALIAAACEMGTLLAGATAEQTAAARQFGEQLGLAFQIIDDLLDVTSTEEELGKPIGGDMGHGKSTYVTLLGKEEARRLADMRTSLSIDALQEFGKQADPLRHLAEAFRNRRS